jgi:hypothetical protein
MYRKLRNQGRINCVSHICLGTPSFLTNTQDLIVVNTAKFGKLSQSSNSKPCTFQISSTVLQFLIFERIFLFKSNSLREASLVFSSGMSKLDMRCVLTATAVVLIPNYAYVSAVGSAVAVSLNTASSLPVLLQGR